MRPVQLNLEGFASYRANTTIDFRDADFFVLVGPTGSGKSTVIDAMVFALYGTVPRWDDRSAVAPALAPTVSRGVVRLIFDVGGKRYAALRDVRRSGGKNPTVSVKEARLEQFLSPNATGDPDDEVVTLATGREVNAAVEGLLGLNFAQFTQSVALPQGEFAQFLHATDAERQSILKNLLGYHVYDRIQKSAYSRESDARSRSDVMTEQLAHFADATPEHIDSQHRIVEGLHELRDHVTSVALPTLKAAFDAAATAQSALQRSTAEREQLQTIAKPAGVESLDAQKSAADTQLDAAEVDERRIEQRDIDIRAALQALHSRHDLEQLLAHWREMDELEGRLPGLAVADGAARTALVDAATARDAAADAAQLARAAGDSAARAAVDQEHGLTTARTYLALVTALRTPDDIADIAESLTSRNESLTGARQRVTDCEAAQQVLVDQLAALPDPALVSAADGAAEQIVAIVTQDNEEAEQRTAAQGAADAAHAESLSAAERLVSAEHALREAEQSDQAAALRSDLHPGDDCPVCGQQITDLPHAGDVDLAAARTALAQAKDEDARARAAATKLDREHQNAVAVRTERLNQCHLALTSLITHLTSLGVDLGALSEPMDSNSLSAVLVAAQTARHHLTESARQRTALEAHRRDADTATTAARAAVRDAEGAVQSAQQRARQAQSALHTTRDTVGALSPPPVDGGDVSAAWSLLTTWAAAQRNSFTDQIDLLAPQAAQARAAAETAAAEAAAAEGLAESTQTALTAASVAASQAETALQTAWARKIELVSVLADEASADAAGVELAQVKTLEHLSAEVSTQLLQARSATGVARETVAAATSAIAGSWEQLRRLRDPLAALGAPDLAGVSLLAEWDQLTAWSAKQAQARTTAIDDAQDALGNADQDAVAAADSLKSAMTGHGIEVATATGPAELVTSAPTAVAAAVATAEGTLRHIEDRHRQSEQMRAETKTLTESAEVAHLLSNLMRANQFPRWLIASALDALLLDASRILLELSGGQFELTRSAQDLLVIDHNDADMSRPVKTLSGGETFQASLALALALSEQVTALAAEGASKLESIFLDEGFGTLDEATLDIVAGTLENLASSGSRMVGVITHVGALAERIPVRFEVIRDSAGSHIERVSV
ncbi:SMC family ATPase [Mycobacterium frederiksbergense]|uniref:AAA family ATPase n=1 Tax=Mycolicibacterium frederiksbergense TaxID=117567 RepID=UPI0021F2506D|nr:SMC family ATPase [Mycolicibacterium frederiksbergense]MCV7046749.1 SMC family ATPase [Mycolicibacterium frederiksbergense]